jgi:predicted transcriptional regulator
MNTLHIRVGEPMDATLERAKAMMLAIERGEVPEPYFGVGFDSLAELLAAFTPRRWELISRLRSAGPLSIAELARRLQRNYKNVHDDVSALMRWEAIRRNEAGRVFVPWDEIDLRLPLVRQAA